jgi:hypothetical protein
VLVAQLLPDFQGLSQFLLLKAEHTLLEMVVEEELAEAAAACKRSLSISYLFSLK